jgi:hypothetical protein
MRRKVIFILAGLLILLPFIASAATVGTVTATPANITADGSVRTVTITWTGDASTGGVSGWATDNIKVPTSFCRSAGTLGNTNCTLTQALAGYWPLVVETQPGSPAPTSYGATFTDSLGLDLFLGNVASRSTTATQQVNIQANIPLGGPYTFALSGQTNASATGTLVIWLLNAGSPQ